MKRGGKVGPARSDRESRSVGRPSLWLRSVAETTDRKAIESMTTEPAAMVHPVIMCGGSGSRLWPVSRLSMPKQFQAFVGERTLLQETVLRVSGPLFAPPTFVTNEEHRFLVRDQVEELGSAKPNAIVLEPMGRNTAAVALAASLLIGREPDGLILLLPSDHLIKDVEAFQALVAAAIPAAQAGAICLFGMEPDRPETGYGYIKIGQEAVPAEGSPVRRVARFVEKPAREDAQRMLEQGHFAWNAGIFLFAPASLLSEASARAPDLLQAVQRAVDQSTRDEEFIRFEAESFGRIPSISIDYALIEGSARTAVLPAALDWNDLGAWDAIHAAHIPDKDGNVLLGRAIATKTSNSFIRTDGQLVATIGVSDLLVVATSDAVLVANRNCAQDVKGTLDLLRAKGFNEASQHAEMHRPWGTYQSVLNGERFQVKIITVKPGGRLSLQLHRHRAEHWIVVRGSARITCGDRSFMLFENQSTFIPQGETHRMENPGKIPLELIEVQSGSYLGEDDIVRVEDIYGRVET